MAVTVADLEKGRTFPSVTFDLSRDWVDAYVAATGDGAIRELGEEAVPPMAIATLAIRALLQNAGLTPGTIHAGQELAFHQATQIGDAVSVDASVVSRGERQGWVLMSIDLEANGASGLLMSGRATITFPLEDAA
jgi:acyl dehydratase